MNERIFCAYSPEDPFFVCGQKKDLFPGKKRDLFSEMRLISLKEKS